MGLRFLEVLLAACESHFSFSVGFGLMRILGLASLVPEQQQMQVLGAGELFSGSKLDSSLLR